jgi:hypothetical protein
MSVEDPRILRIKTPDDMLAILKAKGRPLSTFHQGQTIQVWNKMRKGYSYILTAPPGQNMDSSFKPWADPGEMLALGVFEGKYLNDCLLEFPAEWFLRAIALDKLRPSNPTEEINLLQDDSRQPLSEWRRKGWVPSGQGGSKKTGILADPTKNPDEKVGRKDLLSNPATNPDEKVGRKHLLSNPATNPDERGWFQWYCRYWMGRRLPELDAEQIRRWRAFRRHAGQIKANCTPGVLTCRPRQRQALLQWAWNPFM